MKLPGGEALTYCTNIHPGESWHEIRQNLDVYVLSVKASIANDVPFGIGLRLSASAAKELTEPSVLSEFKSWLSRNNCYVFTINGFPYGDFHTLPVKENVYLPDWRSEYRISYTLMLADLLADLLPNDVVTYGSISTVPIGFREHIVTKEDHQNVIENILLVVEYLIELKNRTGKRIVLALEPEPCCYLETITETIDFLKKFIFSDSSINQVRKYLKIDYIGAELKIREHIGICFDLCHAAVEFEDSTNVIQQIRASKILIPKIQISNSLNITSVNNKTVQSLLEFDDGIYLHQVVERVGQQLNRFKDIKDAVSSYHLKSKGKDMDNHEWRVHFHVPIFLETLSVFHTTQTFIRHILSVHSKYNLTQHFEVETYTWSVLPKQYKDENVSRLITRELIWARDLLQS
tara:strand:- start:5997 stop:7211 length:1215 start_codon:yes stop_codon:yes gene_type:complete